MPESPPPLTPKPPPRARWPEEGPKGDGAPREISVTVVSGGDRVTLEAWCRTEAWTTLGRRRAREFVVRETWGRLGERRPRLLTRVSDQVLSGAFVRVRPHRDGRLSFRVEVAEARVGPKTTVDIYHGRRVSLPSPRRHGIRFAGTAPPGFEGTVARWNDVAVRVGSGEAPAPGTLRFTADGIDGFVAGRDVSAETFVEQWTLADPIHVVADGVERKDYRLRPQREAAGFRTNARGEPVAYGPSFVFERDG